ncbi:MAG: tripartite tricarboxylate transporter substrate binding protein [Acetobacteraceae bacterium]|nr:tripartite tricarboxylate transporter substrate binding protein [Acetobacteraceae bacterium]
MLRRHLAALPLGLLALPAVTPGPARAQAAWPTRPVRVINPYSPGGTTDVVMRLMSERLERAFGQPFPVESRAGAGGSVGTAAAAQATDGHTLLITNTGPLAVAPAMIPNLAFDPARAFTYITMFGGAPILCAVKAGSPIRSIADYVAAARARPEQVSYGNSGAGSMGHLAGLVFEQAAGVKLLHVPFRGAPEAQAAVLSGDTVSIWDTIGAHAGAVRQGSLAPLGFSSAQRVPLFPQVPTLAEAGYPAVEVTNWFLLAGPAALPAETAQRINAVCQAALREPVVAERVAALGLVSLGDLAPAQILDFVRREAARWAPIVRAAGITG